MAKEYIEYLNNDAFPCVAAKAAASKHQIKCMVAENMECPADDRAILDFLYAFVDSYRTSDTPFHSSVVIFKGPVIYSEAHYDTLLWERLQSVSNLDAVKYNYDPRVNSDPASAEFSYSIKSEAFFIIGLHPLNSRPTRRFRYPAIVFNPHAEFERMRLAGGYEKMKALVRKRDMLSSGSVNPMLNDFGNASEVLQYSGRKYESNWQCPLKIEHGTNENDPTP